MRPAFCAIWDGGRWHPKTNKEATPWQLLDAEWIPGVTEAMLPVPRFSEGQRILFAWGDGYLRGTIIRVKTHFPGDLWGIVIYDVKEIGHARTIYDRGNADITYIGDST